MVEPQTATEFDNQTSSEEVQLWADALLAVDVFALAMERAVHKGSIGICIKAQAGPVRDCWLEKLQSRMPHKQVRRLPVGISEEQLIGGLDISDTLVSGHTVVRKGLLASAHNGLLIAPMADGLEPNVAAQIAMVMDSGEIRIERDGLSQEFPSEFGLIAFDESEPDEGGLAAGLADRLMLHIDISKISLRATKVEVKTRLRAVAHEADLSDAQYEDICQMAMAFGLHSMRPAMQVIQISKLVCLLNGRKAVEQSDIVDAVRLTLLGRAAAMPEMPSQEEGEEQEPQPEPEENNQDPEASQSEQNSTEPDETATDLDIPPDDVLLDALAANLPSGLLAQLKATAELNKRKSARSAKGRSGAVKKASTRGRRLSSRRGELRSGNRLDLIATLRAAVPWQKSRGADNKDTIDRAGRVHIRPSDFHIKRYKQKSGSTCLFVVDASGSTALNRLAETKGAVELLLGESYSRRDHVGLVSFRGQAAEVLLSPTRSLVRAKRALAALPGGGGTPLASGLFSALEIATEERRQGRTMSIVVLTDGSANVDMVGNGGRPKALEDALQVAACIRVEGFDVMLIDVGRQPSERAENLARAMDAAYVPMPFASSTSLSQAVRQQAV